MPAPRRLAALAVLTAAFFSTAVHAESLGPAWQQQVARISQGDDTGERAAAIGQRLDELGLQWRRETFSLDGKRGTNLVADVGGGNADAPLLLIGAHYDRVDVGHGATDNASGVATVLALAQALAREPLPAHRVQVAFWDLEEEGLLGARAWVATNGREKPALYVNFDVFGWGDTLWMMQPGQDEPLAKVMQRQAGAAGLGFSAGTEYPPTDHLAFLKNNWPAVSFSLVGGDEIPAILQIFGGETPERMPKVMQVIHSADDTVSQLDPTNVPKALKVLEAGLREWDAAAVNAAASG